MQRSVMLGGLLHVLYVVIALACNHGNLSYFVHFGRGGPMVHAGERLLGSDLLVTDSDGHDGQSFWVLAHDPLLSHPEMAKTSLDRPIYRAQRVFYPLLASPFGWAGEKALLFGLVLVNLMAVLLGTASTAFLAAKLRIPSRVALSFALNPAVLAATGLDLADGLALALVLATAALAYDGKVRLAVCCAVAAALTKESSLFGVIGIALSVPLLPRRARALLMILPALLMGAWALYVRVRLGWGPTGVVELGPPFLGLIRSFDASARGIEIVDMLVALGCFALASAVCVEWFRRRDRILGCAMPYVLLAPFLTHEVIDLMTNSLRAFGPLFAFGILGLYHRVSRVQENSLAATRRYFPQK